MTRVWIVSAKNGVVFLVLFICVCVLLVVSGLVLGLRDRESGITVKEPQRDAAMDPSHKIYPTFRRYEITYNGIKWFALIVSVKPEGAKCSRFQAMLLTPHGADIDDPVRLQPRESGIEVEHSSIKSAEFPIGTIVCQESSDKIRIVDEKWRLSCADDADDVAAEVRRIIQNL